MTDIFNNIFDCWSDPFTHDAGKYLTSSSTRSDTYFNPKPYVPYYYEPDMIGDRFPSNINGNFIVIKTGGGEIPEIKDVIFNPPATVVLWKDGTKTVVKCQNGDVYSKETGLALAICKKVYGNKGAYNDIFNKWLNK